MLASAVQTFFVKKNKYSYFDEFTVEISRNYISKMWESWFALAKQTMFGSDGQAKYDHVKSTTPYQPLSRFRVDCRFLCQPCVLLE